MYDEDGTIEEELVQGDTGPLLVVRRACLAPKYHSDDNWLRQSIFQSSCTIDGKVCSLVIDSGSCENVISQEVVKRLSLTTQEHPNPYKLSWLKKGTVINVSKCCLVKLSIGATYKDEVWCDVVVMDACHLLLGRPWQYDRVTTHDGRNNTYSFVFNNSKIILLPKRDITPTLQAHSGTTLLTQQQFECEVDESHAMYAMMGREQLFNTKIHIPNSANPHSATMSCLSSIQEVHSLANARLSDTNNTYKTSVVISNRADVECNIGNFIWVVLITDFFPVGTSNKLSERRIGPVEIIEKINSNTYRIKLPSHIRSNEVFNINSLIPFLGNNPENGEEPSNSRSNFVSPGENDANRETTVRFRLKRIPNIGPVSRITYVIYGLT